MKAGEFIKVMLPGETPWVKVIAITGANTFMGEISNKVAGDFTAAEWHTRLNGVFESNAEFETDQRMHTFKYGEPVWFEKTDLGSEPAPGEQI